MQAFVLTLHIIACLILVVVVLLQAGKEGMGVIFGGGSTSLFGSAGAGGLLVKVTAVVATVFLVTSLGYNYLTGTHATRETSVMDGQTQEAPAPSKAAEPAKPAAKQGVDIEEKPALPVPAKPDAVKPDAAKPADKNVPAAEAKPSAPPATDTKGQ